MIIELHFPIERVERFFFLEHPVSPPPDRRFFRTRYNTVRDFSPRENRRAYREFFQPLLRLVIFLNLKAIADIGVIKIQLLDRSITYFFFKNRRL